MSFEADVASIEGLVAARGLRCAGVLRARPEDRLPALPDGSAASSIVLLGFGAAQWPAFAAAAERTDGRPDPLDRWSRRVIDALAADLGARPLYPNDGPPWWPFQAWAQRTGFTSSPLGLLIHPAHGLWLAWRGALLLPQPLEERGSTAAAPCASCALRPCIAACPAGALATGRFDAQRCSEYVSSPAGRACRSGCLARQACPVAPAARYGAEQSAFHMRARFPGLPS